MRPPSWRLFLWRHSQTGRVHIPDEYVQRLEQLEQPNKILLAEMETNMDDSELTR